MMDDVVISIVCTNNRAVLEGCLDSLPAACEGLRWRATVVDNAGSDGTSEMVNERFGWAHLVRNDRRHGFGHNHNLTIAPTLKHENARYVMVLNDDTRLDRRAVFEMVQEMDETPDLGAIGPRIRGLDGAPQQSLFRFPSVRHLLVHQFRPGLPPGEAGRAGWLNGSCLVLRREALQQAGSFDESYFIFYEDTDLGYRLLEAGWRSAVSRDAGMVHLEHQTVSMPAVSSMMARQMLRSEWLYASKRTGAWLAFGLSMGTRAALLLRSAKAAAGGARGDGDARLLARALLGLARYRPAEPLPHELAVERG